MKSGSYRWMVIIFLTIIILSGCNKKQSLTNYEEAVLSVTGEVVQLFQDRADEIWPGFDLSEQVFVVYICSTHAGGERLESCL